MYTGTCMIVLNVLSITLLYTLLEKLKEDRTQLILGFQEYFSTF